MSHGALACPHCRARLVSGKPIPAGKVLSCPRCRARFTTPPTRRTRAIPVLLAAVGLLALVPAALWVVHRPADNRTSVPAVPVREGVCEVPAGGPSSRGAGGSEGPAGEEPRAAGGRYAVLVGINDYDHSAFRPLRYAGRDAAETAEVLRKAGYEVTLLTAAEGQDSGRRTTLESIRRELARVLGPRKRQDLVLVGLAGHGLQFEGGKDNYFCPQDANPEDAQTLLSLREVYDQLERSGAGVKLLLVDACRDDPKASRGRGLHGDRAPRPPGGVAALFSCSAGEQAFESDKLEHGVFFHYVVQGLKGEARNADSTVTWDGLQQYVRTRVARDVGKLVGGGVRQTPALTAGELAGEPPVLLALPAPARPEDPPAPPPSDPPATPPSTPPADLPPDPAAGAAVHLPPRDKTEPAPPVAAQVSFPSPGTWELADPARNTVVLRLTLEVDAGYSDGNEEEGINKYYETSGSLIYFKRHNVATGRKDDFLVGRYAPTSRPGVWAFHQLKPDKKEYELRYKR